MRRCCEEWFARVSDAGRRFAPEVWRVSFPYWAAWRQDRRLTRNIREEAKTALLNPDMEKYLSLDEASLADAHKIELERRELIRKSAQANLGAVTLAVTIALALGRVESEPVVAHPIAMLAATVSILSLLFSAICALRAAETGMVFDLWLQTRLQSYGRLTPEGDRKAKLIKSIFLNQGNNLIISNYAAASSIGMRNAVFALIVVLVIALWDNGGFRRVFSPSAPQPKTGCCVGARTCE